MSGELSDVQIQRFLSRDKRFAGCYSKDQIPVLRILKNEQYVIINLDDHTGPGTHWTLWDARHSPAQYFDSYGYPPPKEIPRCPYNHTDLQPMDTSWCGFYCLFMAKKLAGGKDVNAVVQESFSGDPKQDDRKMKSYRASVLRRRQKSKVNRKRGKGVKRSAPTFVYPPKNLTGGVVVTSKPRELIDHISGEVNPMTGKPYGRRVARGLVSGRRR